MTMTHADMTAAAGLDPVSEQAAGPRAGRPKRRTFSAEFKAKILAEYDSAATGERGAILRREGLYSSNIVEWRRAAHQGAQAALGPAVRDDRDKQITELTARAERTEVELARTKAALDLVGKAHALLEMLSESAEQRKK